MTSDKTSRSRLPGRIFVAVLSLPIGVALTWWASSTQMTAGAWAVVLVAGLVLVLLLLGPKAVKQ